MRAICVLVVCAGCRTVLGIDSPITQEPDGAVPVDSAEIAIDAPSGGGDASTVDAAPGLPFAVQAASQDASNSTSLTVTFPAAVVTDDLIVVAVGAEDESPNITLSDTLGTTFLVAVPSTVTNHLSQQMYYAFASTSGTEAITVSFASKEAALDARIAAYRGVSKVAPVDVHADNTGHSNLCDVKVTTTGSNELLVAADGSMAFTTAPGTGYTNRVLSSTYKVMLEDRLATTPGMYDANASLDSSDDWLIQVAAFRPKE